MYEFLLMSQYNGHCSPIAAGEVNQPNPVGAWFPVMATSIPSGTCAAGWTSSPCSARPSVPRRSGSFSDRGADPSIFSFSGVDRWRSGIEGSSCWRRVSGCVPCSGVRQPSITKPIRSAHRLIPAPFPRSDRPRRRLRHSRRKPPKCGSKGKEKGEKGKKPPSELSKIVWPI
jgi:hypothetical protein